MKTIVPKPQRCAIYTRKSSEHNLDLEFNSLDAQREACEAYITSQAHEGWRLNPDRERAPHGLRLATWDLGLATCKWSDKARSRVRFD
jgi:hypothetical protein